MYNKNVIVSIPGGAHIRKSDAAVYIVDSITYHPDKQYATTTRTTIGRSVGNGRMYPNRNYQLRYPRQYEEATGVSQPRQLKRIGFYAVCLSIAEGTGLYSCMVQAFGPENANMLMDFSMYSILAHSCASENFAAFMKDQLLFSDKVWNPSELSSFWNNRITEEMVRTFRKLWAERRRELVKEVWLAIDGSNNDCDCTDSELAELGKAKSLRDGQTILGYMYAVDASTGDPITWFTYRGGRVDCKEIMEVIGWLNAFDIRVRGVIVDRGFSTEDALKKLDECGYPYVAMLKGNTLAAQTMRDQYASTIRMQYEYMLGRYQEGEDPEAAASAAGEDSSLYGTDSGEKLQLWKLSDYRSYVSLIYNSRSGRERQEDWNQKVSDTARSLQKKLDRGQKSVVIPGEFASCMEIATRGEDQHRTVIVDASAVQKAGNQKGFYTLATSQKMTATEADCIYNLRDSSEKQFSMLKSQLGYDSTNMQKDSATQIKMAAGFIASVIRNELVKACRAADVSTNRVIQELNQLTMMTDARNKYFYAHNEGKREIRLLNACGIQTDDLDRIAADENSRLSSAEKDPYRRFPERPSMDNPVRKSGRPKGSKNRTHKVKPEADPNAPKRGRGRPKGSKNKKTIEREKAAAAAKEETEKRGPGRPKGSRNKKTIEREKAAAAARKQSAQKTGASAEAGKKPKVRTAGPDQMVESMVKINSAEHQEDAQNTQHESGKKSP